MTFCWDRVSRSLISTSRQNLGEEKLEKWKQLPQQPRGDLQRVLSTYDLIDRLKMTLASPDSAGLQVKQLHGYSDGWTRFRSAWKWLLSTKLWHLQALEASGYDSRGMTWFLTFPTPYAHPLSFVSRGRWFQSPAQAGTREEVGHTKNRDTSESFEKKSSNQ